MSNISQEKWNNKKITIRNYFTKEYICASNDTKGYFVCNRWIYTASNKQKVDFSDWILEYMGNDMFAIKNVHFNEYLFAGASSWYKKGETLGIYVNPLATVEGAAKIPQVSTQTTAIMTNGASSSDRYVFTENPYLWQTPKPRDESYYWYICQVDGKAENIVTFQNAAHNEFMVNSRDENYAYYLYTSGHHYVYTSGAGSAAAAVPECHWEINLS